jgi:Domain of unknown function (DUF1996)
MRTHWIGLLGSLVLLAAAAAPTAVRADRGAQARGTNFFSDCRFSHAAPDDPIVHPGVHGFSHPHQFFGNVSTNASSTLATLLAHGTSCNRSADTAAYWVPALYRHGRVVKPLGVSVYYQIRSLGRIRPFPAGLKIVAGNAAARSPQSTRIVFWNCAYPPGPTKHVPSPPMCPQGRPRMIPRGRDTDGHLRLNINFPDCWDGRRLDSADHQSHMAYSIALRCPASYPVKVPALRLTVIYPIRGGSDLALASGGLYTGHADFFNAWNERELARLVAACAAEEKHCSRPAR